jgi:tripartite-type tricarboxylate transporter receptor subunit TctC
MNKRMAATLVAAVMACAAAAIAAATATQSQNFPARPVTLVVPWPAGGTTDVVMRALATATEKHLGQSLVTENRPGAAGTLGPGAMAANAKPDGYTIAQIPITVFRYPFLRKTTFDPTKDFTYIIGLTGYTFGVVVRKDAPWKTFRDLLADAKANPGKINYGSPSPGSQANLAFTLFQRQTGIALQAIAYRGASQAMTDLIGGHIGVTSTALTSASGAIRGGKARALAVTSRKRVQDFPDIPTFAEQGHPTIVAEVWFALSGPKGIPADVVKRVNAEVVKAFQTPEVQARLVREGIEFEPLDPAAFLDFYRAENAKGGPLAKEVIGPN